MCGGGGGGGSDNDDDDDGIFGFNDMGVCFGERPNTRDIAVVNPVNCIENNDDDGGR